MGKEKFSLISWGIWARRLYLRVEFNSIRTWSYFFHQKWIARNQKTKSYASTARRDPHSIPIFFLEWGNSTYPPLPLVYRSVGLLIPLTNEGLAFHEGLGLEVKRKIPRCSGRLWRSSQYRSISGTPTVASERTEKSPLRANLDRAVLHVWLSSHFHPLNPFY